MRRGAFTLVELLFFGAAALMIIGYGWDLLRSGSVIGSTTSEGINLQRGVRNFMENLVKDVNGAALIGEPHGNTPLPGSRIVVYVFDDKKEDADGGIVLPGERINFGVGTSNGGPDAAGLSGGINPYPFGHTENPTRWHLPVVQVTYEFDPTGGKMTREAIPGDLWSEAPRGVPFVNKYSFHAASSTGTPVKTVVSENIKNLEVFPFGYDESVIDPVTKLGALRPTSELPDFVTGLETAAAAPVLAGFGGAGGGAGVGSGDRMARTAMILVKVEAVFDYTNDAYRDPEFEMATKIWSFAKLYEHRYFPYFSSIDDDLRF